ncbi:uncharacterized protein LOC121727395 [Aricia agestis]|uniref:uncharacterized protein LOC121727395 n=1 Tax=Aricia agestis TaxID=91739 RepID=UPI001C2073D3|nr:uncharacterized protein LOC121727395 [Aricia agestis]
MMLAQPKNRVQAIKSKFESLSVENDVLIVGKKSAQLNKQTSLTHKTQTEACRLIKDRFENEPLLQEDKHNNECDSSNIECSIEPNASYLYSISDVRKSFSDGKTALSRQSSDPGKKLHRSHAFRCDRSIKINSSPKRHGSCSGRSETGDFTLKMGEKKLSKDKLKQLGNFLEIQMKKENFKPSIDPVFIVGEVREVTSDSVPDSAVPKHILDQYAKVTKAKKEDKLDSMTDSGISSETENLEENKLNRVHRSGSKIAPVENEAHPDNSKFCKTSISTSSLENSDNISNPEIPTSDLGSKGDLYASSETMRLERKNPHLKLTDTLKKALKQPLPPGPPPEKPPRTFAAASNESEKPKKDVKKMLEKLEEAVQKREGRKNIYDIVEEDDTKKEAPKSKEIHYLCTNILDTTRTLAPINDNIKTPISNCLNKLNCAIVANSTLSLPYTKLSNDTNPCCSCSKENLNDHKWLSTFKDPEKCVKCQVNETTVGFKCHVNCACKESKKSEFYVKDSDIHIYDEPFEVTKTDGHYGILNSWKAEGASRSMEDLKPTESEDQKIYDEPCITRHSEPPKTDFQKLIDNFERPIQPKNLNDKTWKSSENVCDDYKAAKKAVVTMFATEPKRYKKNEKLRDQKKDCQVDVDRENLNRLMSEIYETVTAACNMADNKPGSFPTDAADTTSEESVRLTRSLTEKRKNYVRRVSSRVAYLEPRVRNRRFRHETSVCSTKSECLENPYSTFRSWKSFRNSQGNLSRDKMERSESTDSKCNLTDSSGNLLSMVNDSMDNLSIDEKTGCVDIELPFEPRERGLFNVCLLVGLNYFKGQAYVKSVFPSQVRVPPHIESLIFPETLSGGTGELAGSSGQCYSLVLTDERGERAYGYCRRVLPEGATTCLPLCYCLIGKYRAPGFYYKILKEIESQHGNSELEINDILQQLFETDFPAPGEQITLTYRPSGDRTASVTVRRGTDEEADEDVENNNSPKSYGPRRAVIRRGIEPRADEHNASALLDALGAGLLVKVFGSLLLERKVVIVGDHLGMVSSCLEALQGALYPFVWQQPLISAIPAAIQRDVLEAPLPILAGMLRAPALDASQLLFEEGMLIDLTNPNKVLFYQGDEATILPTASYKTLKTSLQMESSKSRDRQEDERTRNVMIYEAFLRFFVDILGDFWKFFSAGEVTEGALGKNGVVFDKENFVRSAKSKQVQYFLEWFTETAMFNHFIQNMAVSYRQEVGEAPFEEAGLVDTPLPDFYELFHERVRSRTKSENKLNDSKVNYKSAVNKKVKLLKTKLRDLVA